MLPSGDVGGRGRQFNKVDYSQSAAAQAQALSSSTDAPQAGSQPTSDDAGGHWRGKLPGGVDESWVRRAVSLLGQDKVGSFEDLADPEHRKWLRRKMNKAKQAQAAAPPAEVADEEAAPVEEEAPQVAEGGRSVIPSGRIPSRSLDRPTTGVPGPGGWVPAGDDLWWPPYPTTGGPMARPETVAGAAPPMEMTFTAGDQANGLEGKYKTSTPPRDDYLLNRG